MIVIKRILFPTDFTENSSKILPYVLSVSEKYDAMVYLVHVIEDIPKWSGYYVPHFPFDLYKDDALKSAKKALDEICKNQLQGCPNFKKKILFGDPIQEILKAIELESIDLVIMATHGRKGLEHVFFGSVAENVVKKSPVPVMIVNPYKVI